ncbi:MAG TPA: hypothetical protein VFH99_02430 [Candidatus Saccharimonadales bacterium]|nr:hypothetical protein [Candidatus Saccharimonadales bacterium]
MASSFAWQKIFNDYKILDHDFRSKPFYLSAAQIKAATRSFNSVAEREVRILCKQDSRRDRPKVFTDSNLFILPVKNGEYAIVQGDGYVDIPDISSEPITYDSKLDFHLDTAVIGNSEMQHLDMAYASSLIRTFMEDSTLVLTIRGRKYTPEFSFLVNSQKVQVKGVQTEVDAGYEGRDKVVLIEAKSSSSKDTIIRQMFYPFKQWQTSTKKEVFTLFFERDLKNNTYNIWQFGFSDENDYNSIKLLKSCRYKLVHKNFEEKPTIG